MRRSYVGTILNAPILVRLVGLDLFVPKVGLARVRCSNAVMVRSRVHAIFIRV